MEKPNNKKDREEKELKVFNMLMTGTFDSKKFKSPTFQLYVQDFLVGTMNMTASALGSYFLLLCHQWDQHGLPDDQEELMDLGKCDENVLNKLKKKFEKCKDGKLRNTKLEKIRSQQIVNRGFKSIAGSAGCEARWGKAEVIKEKESSPKTKEVAGAYYKIAGQMYRGNISEYMTDHMAVWMDQWEMKNKPLKVSDVLLQMEKEFPCWEYSGESHIRSCFKKASEKTKVSKGKKENRSACPYTDDQIRLADAQKASGMGTPEWFDEKKWSHLLNN
ncbi:MAG: YdaU family protein [Bacteroidota bacterium]|nr:YdaU family protein [Bacteroidota bacterium]